MTDKVYLTIDRIEENIAVCEADNGNMIEIALSLLPDGVREGSIVSASSGGSYTLDTEAEKKRRQVLFEMQEELFDE